jgi:hypothetical protein
VASLLASLLVSLEPFMDDKLLPHKIAPNLNLPTRRAAASSSASPGRSATGATPADKQEAVFAAIAVALPEFERWAPATLSDRAPVGHGAPRPPTREERAQHLTERAVGQANVGSRLDLSVERVRRAHATVNTLLAGFYAAPRGVKDATAMRALRDIIPLVEAFEVARKDDRDAAVAAALMAELPDIYERVREGTLEQHQEDALVQELLHRTGLFPADPAKLELVLDELVCEKSFIDAALDDLPDPADTGRTVTKPGGAVETAAHTLSAALHLLGVQWPHRRGTLMRARKMSDQAKMLAFASAPFGSHVGPVEAAGYAQLAAAGGECTTIELSTSPLPA